MSTSTFKRTFKKTFNETPATYIKNMKLQKAAQLLLNDDLRVSDILYDCGFDSPTSFTRLFKNRYGMSPTNYRLNQKDK